MIHSFGCSSSDQVETITLSCCVCLCCLFFVNKIAGGQKLYAVLVQFCTHCGQPVKAIFPYNGGRLKNNSWWQWTQWRSQLHRQEPILIGSSSFWFWKTSLPVGGATGQSFATVCGKLVGTGKFNIADPGLMSQLQHMGHVTRRRVELAEFVAFPCRPKAINVLSLQERHACIVARHSHFSL